MSDRDLNARLLAYLVDYERDQKDGNTIANIRIEMHSLRQDVHTLAARVTNLELRAERHGKSIRKLESEKNDKNSNDDELNNTDRFQVEALRRHLKDKEKELEEHRASKLWWKYKTRDLAIGAVVGLVGIVIAAIGTFIWWIFNRVVGK